MLMNAIIAIIITIIVNIVIMFVMCSDRMLRAKVEIEQHSKRRPGTVN